MRIFTLIEFESNMNPESDLTNVMESLNIAPMVEDYPMLEQVAPMIEDVHPCCVDANNVVQRDRVVAVVTSDLMQTFEPMILEGGIYSIESFQFYPLGYDDFPRYETYALHRDEYEIRFYQKTRLIPLESTSVGFELQFYPKLYSLYYLAGVKTKFLIDVVRKLVRGQLKSFRDKWNLHRPRYLELILKDLTPGVKNEIV